MQFTYRGQTATLQTSSDIAAWIEERKKRFPTKARAQEAAERKHLFQEAQKASNEALKQKQEKRKNDLRERQKQEKVEEERKGREEAKLDPRDAALKAKIKAEKLRRRLNKEERRVAKAEAKAEEARVNAEAAQNGGFFSQSVITGAKRKRSESDEGGESVSAAFTTPAIKTETGLRDKREEEELDAEVAESAVREDRTVIEDNGHVISLEEMIAEASTNVCNTTTSEPQPPVAISDPSVAPTGASATLSNTWIVEAPPEEHVAETDSDSDDTMSISSSSPDPSDDADDTSSSGSSSDEDAPDEAPSKRDGPVRVPPPKREKPKSICRQFLKTGHCKRGDRCSFLHELPERGSARAGLVNGSKVAKGAKAEAKPKRKKLYERVRRST